MQSDYQIEDLVFQNNELVLYRAHDRSGIPFAIRRLKFSEEVLENLQKQDRFQHGLEQLLLLDNPNLRKTVDGGLDPIDGHPWVATKWIEGTTLSETAITKEGIESLRKQALDLIADLDYRAGALAFNSSNVVVANAHQGQARYTFAIDFFSWFRDWSIGYPPGERNNPHNALEALISSLKPTEPEQKKPQNQSPRANVPTMLVTSTLPAQTFTPKDESTPNAPTPQVAPAPQETPVRLAPPQTSILKPALLIGSLVLLIVAGVLWINSRAPQSPNTTADQQEDTNENPSSSNTSSPNLQTPDTPPTNGDETPPTPGTVTTSSKSPPARPEFAGEMLDIDASDKELLEESAGQWIVLVGTTSKTTKGGLSFENALVKAQLPEDSPGIDSGRNVKITGYLKNSSQLVVETPEDLVVARSQKTIYTIDDEEKLRNMNKARITLRATVRDYTQTKTGSTLYLVFHEDGPGFRAGISPSKSRDKIDEEFLRSFVGKEILLNGTVTTFERATGGRGNRLVIRFTKKSDIKLADE